MDAAHLAGPTSGSWAKSRSPGALRGPLGPPKGPFWAKTGPFGGPRSAIEVRLEAQAHDMDAGHPVGPTSDSWAKKKAPQGTPRPSGAPKRAFRGPNGPFWGPEECHRGP